MYIAIKHVRANGKMVPIGGTLPAGLPADVIDRLLGLGAIREDAPGKPVPETVPVVDAGEAEAEGEDVIGSDEIDIMDGIVTKPEKKPAGADKKKGRSRK